MVSLGNQGPEVQGVTLRQMLHGHQSEIGRMAWSPDGTRLASSSRDQTVCIWHYETGNLQQRLEGHSQKVISVAWSKDGQWLASGSGDRTIRLWPMATGQAARLLSGHTDAVNSVAWGHGLNLASGSEDGTVRLWQVNLPDSRPTSPHLLYHHQAGVNCVAWSSDGQWLASGSDDQTIALIKITNGQLSPDSLVLNGHAKRVTSLAWSAGGQWLASGSYDCTIRLWHPQTGQELVALEGHEGDIFSLAFAWGDRLLASKSSDGTVRFWDCKTWDFLGVLPEPASNFWPPGLAFHPTDAVLATLGRRDTCIRLWSIDWAALLGTAAAAIETVPGTLAPAVTSASVHYTNAKVVLMGDTGVGKSGLGMVLAGQPFTPTASTHGRCVWTFASAAVTTADGRSETRETLLWDLAGQPGYRLIHQLHLKEVAIALVVFDARSETDPFSGVYYWSRALAQVQAMGQGANPNLRKFLVLARADRGGLGVSSDRVQNLMRDLGFDGYFETSAREGWQIAELAEAIQQAIPWEALPKVSSNHLFQTIKTFLVQEKAAKRLLSTVEDLYRAFVRSPTAPPASDGLRHQFDTCIDLVQSRGLIYRLSFGGMVLLQPELLDAYASAIINAARDEPDGLGFIFREDVLGRRLRLPQEVQMLDPEPERLLLIATMEELLRHEIALLEQTEAGPLLVFPSQLTRPQPKLSDLSGQTLVFEFQGAILSVYTTLAVRLSRSGIFNKQDMWQNAVLYQATVGGQCGIWLNQLEEGRAELTLFFSPDTNDIIRLQFEQYVQTHLQRRVMPNSLQRRRLFICPDCSEPLTDSQVQKRRSRGFDTITCAVCETRFSILDTAEKVMQPAAGTVSQMDRAADQKRGLDTAIAILQGKLETNDFDVFLCHNSQDKPAVKAIGEQLKRYGILPWLDEWNLAPFTPWQDELQRIIPQMKAVAVFIGPSGLGPWLNLEMKAFLREFATTGKLRMGLVLLPGCPEEFEFPLFMQDFHWVDFRTPDPDPLAQLMWGITGMREPPFLQPRRP